MSDRSTIRVRVEPPTDKYAAKYHIEKVWGEGDTEYVEEIFSCNKWWFLELRQAINETYEREVYDD